jgi:hypothetical protein
MRKIAIGLSALLLTAAMSKPGAAQDGSAMVFPQHPVCIWYEAVEFPGCMSYRTLNDEQARTARGHPIRRTANSGISTPGIDRGTRSRARIAHCPICLPIAAA